MDKLKPCGCGGTGRIRQNFDPDTSGGFYFIECGKCGGKGPESYAVETCPIFFEQVRNGWNNMFSTTPTVQQAAKALLDQLGDLDDAILTASCDAATHYVDEFDVDGIFKTVLRALAGEAE